MNPTQLYEAAVLVDESPQVLTDATFTEPLRGSLKGLNGALMAAVEKYGIDREEAEQWLSDTQRLFNRWVEPGLREAADLAVRLSALAYVLSGQGPDKGIDSVQLLATATTDV